MKLTRRELAAVVSATAMATVPAQAQQPPANRVDELQTARDRMKANGDLLAQQQVPMATEPAFQFKA
jgi:hypothetical protein